jgi:hypothetical protein
VTMRPTSARGPVAGALLVAAALALPGAVRAQGDWSLFGGLTLGLRIGS